MANAVELSNLALSHLGDDSVVVSLSPPDGSVEAGLCARFYPIARRLVLAGFSWAFATKRAQLAELAANPSDVWAHAYVLPVDCLRAWRVLNPQGVGESDSAAFEIEGSALLTDQPHAVLVYTRDVTDTTQFTPGFEQALTYMLASYLAGPLVKGNEGAKTASSLRELSNSAAVAAAASYANSSGHKQGWTGEFVPGDIAARL